jgi:hypothetical protein
VLKNTLANRRSFLRTAVNANLRRTCETLNAKSSSYFSLRLQQENYTVNPMKYAAAFVSLLFAAPASAALIVVQGTSNIFAAGSPTVPPAAGDGTVPPSFSFAASSNLILQFSSVTGTIGADMSPARTNGPDGGVYFGNVGTDINSAGGISGITHSDFNMFLTGVFLDGSIPATAPSRLSFSQPEDFLTLSPQLGQTFFIGDGRTDTGALLQTFRVPDGATDLYLGFADAADPVPFQGDPGFYFDNIGSLTADFTVAAVPEPSSAILLASVTGVTLLRRRRRHIDEPRIVPKSRWPRVLVMANCFSRLGESGRYPT